MPEQQPTTGQPTRPELDAVIVGGGFAGVYSLYKLKSLGLRVRVFEAGSDVGGTWFLNRYPGARCDVESIDYSYSFPRFEQEYLEGAVRSPARDPGLSTRSSNASACGRNAVHTRVRPASFDEQTAPGRYRTRAAIPLPLAYCIFATGFLSIPQPRISRPWRFQGRAVRTGRWPHETSTWPGTGRGVGTGSSGIQSVPPAAQAARILRLPALAQLQHPRVQPSADPAELTSSRPGTSRAPRRQRAGPGHPAPASPDVRRLVP